MPVLRAHEAVCVHLLFENLAQRSPEPPGHPAGGGRPGGAGHGDLAKASVGLAGPPSPPGSTN